MNKRADPMPPAAPRMPKTTTSYGGSAGTLRRVTDFAYKPTLTGDLVVLRPVDERDYDTLAAAMDDPEVTRVDEIIMSVLASDWVPSKDDPR